MKWEQKGKKKGGAHYEATGQNWFTLEMLQSSALTLFFNSK